MIRTDRHVDTAFDELFDDAHHIERAVMDGVGRLLEGAFPSPFDVPRMDEVDAFFGEFDDLEQVVVRRGAVGSRTERDAVVPARHGFEQLPKTRLCLSVIMFLQIKERKEVCNGTRLRF